MIFATSVTAEFTCNTWQSSKSLLEIAISFVIHSRFTEMYVHLFALQIQPMPVLKNEHSHEAETNGCQSVLTTELS